METALASATHRQKEQDLFRSISLTSLLTGTLAIVAANIQYYFTTHHGVTLKLTGTEDPLSFITYLSEGGPNYYFKYIARAVFGDEATTGGSLMVIWGGVFHYMIAFLFTAFLFVIYPAVSNWFKASWLVIIIYGIFTWAIMNLAVLPLSKLRSFPTDPISETISVFILILMIGIPVVIKARRFYNVRKLS